MTKRITVSIEAVKAVLSAIRRLQLDRERIQYTEEQRRLFDRFEYNNLLDYKDEFGVENLMSAIGELEDNAKR